MIASIDTWIILICVLANHLARESDRTHLPNQKRANQLQTKIGSGEKQDNETWRRTEAMRKDPTITSIMGLRQTEAT